MSTFSVDNSVDKFPRSRVFPLFKVISGFCLIFRQIVNLLFFQDIFIHLRQATENIREFVTFLLTICDGWTTFGTPQKTQDNFTPEYRVSAT